MSEHEFFPRVKKTIVPRPVEVKETDVLGQSGSARATDAIIYGDNWYHNREEDLIEIFDAGPALTFRHLLPQKDKYAREGLYLRLAIAYRTTEEAWANIRTFSGNHVTLPNAVRGAMYVDPNTVHWVTDDMTLNVNSLYTGEKFWVQRVDWEWVSRELVYEDELVKKGPILKRTPEEVEALYAKHEATREQVKQFLIERINEDDHFAKRCLTLLHTDRLLERDLVALYRDLGLGEE